MKKLFSNIERNKRSLYCLKKNKFLEGDSDIRQCFEHVGRTVQGLRAIRNYTVEQLAVKLDIPVSVLTKIEAGEQWVSVAFLREVTSCCDARTMVFQQCFARKVPKKLIKHYELILDDIEYAKEAFSKKKRLS